MIKLTCPSCNGMLELPDNLGVAHCMYCGTKILLQQPDVVKDKETILRYKELCKTALESKNYIEAIQYSNHILEINTRDVDAWIYKADATFWLKTEANNRYDEAFTYLHKAEENAPNDSKIRDAIDELRHRQADWFVYLGKKKIEEGQEILENVAGTYYNSLESINTNIAAQNECKNCYIEAMGYYCKAGEYTPSDINIKMNIADLVKKSDITMANGMKYIEWPDSINQIANDIKMLRDKPLAEQHLPLLKHQLQEAQKTFAALKKNIFSNRSKISDVEKEIQYLKEKITKYEEIIAYKVAS